MTLNVEDYRRFYADEIRFVANLDSPALVEAFARVPREKFIGPGPWQVGSAEVRALAAAGMGRATYVTIDDPRHLYHNVVVVLDAARDLNNGQPSALAHWINGLRLQPGNRVYHVGCGVGYYTAIMAEVLVQAGQWWRRKSIRISLLARGRICRTTGTWQSTRRMGLSLIRENAMRCSLTRV